MDTLEVTRNIRHDDTGDHLSPALVTEQKFWIMRLLRCLFPKFESIDTQYLMVISQSEQGCLLIGWFICWPKPLAVSPSCQWGGLRWSRRLTSDSRSAQASAGTADGEAASPPSGHQSPAWPFPCSLLRERKQG